MIERLVDVPVGVDAFRIRGKVTKEDVEIDLKPLLEQARMQDEKLRLLYYFGPDFNGFTTGGAWEDFKIGLHLLRFIERCAIVSDISRIRESSYLIATMVPFPIHVFADNQIEDAKMWLNAPVEGIAIPHKLMIEKGVLLIEVTRPLRAEDFDAIASTVDPWIEAYGMLRGVVLHAPRDFPGWDTLGSFLRHLSFVRNHHRAVHRVALAAGGKFMELLPKLTDHFVQAEVKHFDENRLQNAIDWASQEPVTLAAE